MRAEVKHCKPLKGEGGNRGDDGPMTAADLRFPPQDLDVTGQRVPRGGSRLLALSPGVQGAVGGSLPFLGVFLDKFFPQKGRFWSMESQVVEGQMASHQRLLICTYSTSQSYFLC